MADYLKYQQRKLREQLAASPYNQLRSEISQVGRETQKVARQTDATLKRQSVPLGARIEGQRQLQTNYAQNISSAYDRVSTQDAQRKQGLMSELDAVNMQIAEQEEQNEKGFLNTAIQVGGTIAGAGIGFVASGFNPAGALIGAQYGASAGQATSGVVGLASGDATAQDWANAGQGLISGISTLSEQANLKSIKAENTEAMQAMNVIYNDPDLTEIERDWRLEQIKVGLGIGMSMKEITDTFTDVNKMEFPQQQGIEVNSFGNA